MDWSVLSQIAQMSAGNPYITTIAAFASISGVNLSALLKLLRSRPIEEGDDDTQHEELIASARGIVVPEILDKEIANWKAYHGIGNQLATYTEDIYTVLKAIDFNAANAVTALSTAVEISNRFRRAEADSAPLFKDLVEDLVRSGYEPLLSGIELLAEMGDAETMAALSRLRNWEGEHYHLQFDTWSRDLALAVNATDDWPPRDFPENASVSRELVEYYVERRAVAHKALVFSTTLLMTTRYLDLKSHMPMKVDTNLRANIFGDLMHNLNAETRSSIVEGTNGLIWKCIDIVRRPDL